MIATKTKRDLTPCDMAAPHPFIQNALGRCVRCGAKKYDATGPRRRR